MRGSLGFFTARFVPFNVFSKVNESQPNFLPRAHGEYSDDFFFWSPKILYNGST